MDGDWTLIVTVAAGLSLFGVIGLTVLTGLRFQRECRRVAALGRRQAVVAPLVEDRQESRKAERHEIERLEAEKAAATEELGRLQQELVWLEQTRNEADQQCRQAVAAGHRAAEEAVTGGREEIQALEQQSRTLTEEGNLLRARSQDERHALNQLIAEHRQAEQSRNELLSSIRELRQRREALTEDEVAVVRELKAHRIELNTLLGEIETRRAERMELERQVEDTTVVLRSSGERETLAASDALTRLHEERAAVERALEDQRREVAALVAEAATVCADIERDRQAGVQMSEGIAVAERRRAEIVAAAREFEQRREALAEEAVATGRATEAARVELTRVREDAAATIADLEHRRAEMIASFNEIQQRQAALVKEIEALDRERQALSEHLATLRQAVGIAPVVSPAPAPALAPKPAKAAAPSGPAPGAAKVKTPFGFFEKMMAPRKPVVAAKPVPKPAPRPAPEPALKPAPKPTPSPTKGAPPQFNAGAAAGAALRTTIKVLDRAFAGTLFGKPAPKRTAAPRRKEK